MSEQFDIKVRVDPGNSQASINQVVNDLKRAEVEAQRLADESKRASAELSHGMQSAARAFGPLTEAIRRSEQMLERIHGPARKYAEDLQTLDSLLHKNAISASEYAAQVTRLNHAIDGVPKQVAQGASSDGMAGTAQGIAKLDAFAKQSADSMKILNERVKEVGKGVAFGLMAQQFNNLKGALDDTSAAALSAGASGAAMGATFAGPWGAAIGGAIGIAKGFITGLLDEEKALEAARKKLEEQAQAYWDQVHAAERAKAVADELATTQADLAEAERQATEAAEAHHRILNAAPDAFRRAADEARAYQDRLTEVDYQLREQLRLRGLLVDPKYGVDPNAGQPDEAAKAITSARGQRDAEIAKYAATKSYGDLLKSMEHDENARTDRMRDLEQIIGDINVSEAVQKRALEEYNKLTKQAATETHALAKELEEADTRMRALMRANMTSEFDGLLKAHLGFGPRSALEKQQNPGVDFAGTKDNVRVAQQLTEEMQADLAAKAEKANREAAESAKKAAQATKEAWASGLGEIGRSFLDAAAEGKASWHEMTEQMIQDLTKLAIKMAVMKLVSGGGSGAVAGNFLSGLGGGAHGFDYVANSERMQLPGFAHGVDGIVSGGGGVDSHLLMARVSPGESVHVRTPQQQEEMRAAAMRAGSGGVQPRLTVNVIARNDPREVTAAMGTYDGLRATAKINRTFARQRLG